MEVEERSSAPYRWDSIGGDEAWRVSKRSDSGSWTFAHAEGIFGWPSPSPRCTARTHSPSSSNADHPLRRRNPHDIVRLLDVEFALASNPADLAAEIASCPRHTHLHAPLPPPLTRHQGDALVSAWQFTRKAAAAFDPDKVLFLRYDRGDAV
ncbi:hypothetical protein PR202_gb27026 [Eleusine coracana subsp. coracana]|uniref:Uncharacterized protein n=1 Tax=Eleusine coracana subsp. coracana TaxID=191504 RepID=A0AAV5FU66_ELECO|nr:hypothetical protein PR202_gb27026 [Eleusine coracana subsp. coracana]